MADYKKSRDFGPGGIRCSCCRKAGQSSKEAKRVEAKRVRRDSKREIRESV